MKTLTLLVGLPASGKSTWRADHAEEGYSVISTDDLIELTAQAQGKTYNETFADVIDKATHITKETFKRYLDLGVDVVVDRTNMSIKTRRPYVELARKKGYYVTAVVFAMPKTDSAHEEWNRRLGSRPGKVIPTNTLIDMFCNFKMPSQEEGVDAITMIDTFKDA